MGKVHVWPYVNQVLLRINTIKKYEFSQLLTEVSHTVTLTILDNVHHPILSFI
jgi:hypothetical protein